MTMQSAPRVVIQGDRVWHERISIEHEATLADFLKANSENQPINSGPLPYGCVYFTHNRTGNGQMGVAKYSMLLPSGIWKLRYCDQGSTRVSLSETKILDLSMPDILLTISVLPSPSGSIEQGATGTASLHAIFPEHPAKGMTYAFSSKLPVSVTPGMRIFRLPLPNQYSPDNGQSDGQEILCFGKPDISSDLPLARRLNIFVQHIIHSVWNKDLAYLFFDVSATQPANGRSELLGVTSLQHWHEQTLLNPLYFRSMKFPVSAYKTLENLHNSKMER